MAKSDEAKGRQVCDRFFFLQIGCYLFSNEIVVRQIVVEGVNHPLSVLERVRIKKRNIATDLVRLIFRVAGLVEPHASQALAVSGALHYTGGELNWGFGDPVTVPPLDGLLSMQASGPQLEIQDNKKQKLAMAFVENKMIVLQVLQAFPQLLGMAELGGDPNEEVYRTSRPLDFSNLGDGAGA